jgi:hypothetical protein
MSGDVGKVFIHFAYEENTPGQIRFIKLGFAGDLA